MPISYEIDHQKELVRGHGTGGITIEDFAVDLNARESSPVNHYPYLMDLIGAITDITADEMRELVALRRRIADQVPPAPIAFAADDRHLFAVLRMMQMHTETIRPIGVFSNLPEAERWLESVRHANEL